MNTLKVLLWICGVGCLTAAVIVVLPWDAVSRLYEWCGEEPVPEVASAVYLHRVACGVIALIGIFFVILAREPARHPAMVALAGWGLQSGLRVRERARRGTEDR